MARSVIGFNFWHEASSACQNKLPLKNVWFSFALVSSTKTLAINENIKKIVELSEIPAALRGLCLDVALYNATHDDFCIRQDKNGQHLAAVWRFLFDTNDSDSFKVIDDRVVCTVNEWQRFHSVKALVSVRLRANAHNSDYIT